MQNIVRANRSTGRTLKTPFGFTQAQARQILRRRGQWPIRPASWPLSEAACDLHVMAAFQDHWANLEQFDGHVTAYLDGAVLTRAD